MVDPADQQQPGERQRSGEHQHLDQQEAEQVEPVRPPDLNQESNRSATRLELFFDLAFVLFVARCADLLAKDETWHGAALFAAVLTVGWWSWASTTLHANRFDTDDTVFRLFTLTAMAAVVVMAAAVDKVSTPTGRWFVVGYVVIRLVLVAGYVRAWRHVQSARTTIRPYLIGHGVSAGVWLVSLAVATPGRYVLWAVGVLLDLIGPAVAARIEEAVPLHLEHLPERFALFIILVLGESVAAIVTGLHDSGHFAQASLTALPAFVVAAVLWWVYFDLSGGAAKRRLVEEGSDRTRQGVHDFYLYAHLPIAICLAAVAVGLEHAVLHGAEDHLSTGTRWVLGAGLAGYLLSAAVMQAVLGRRVRGALAWPGAGVPVMLAIALLEVSPVTTVTLLALVAVAGVIVGFILHRKGEVRIAEV